MEAEEPALALDAVEGRVPPHGLAHVGHGAHDERVEAAPDVALPAGHRGDVGLHRGVAVGLGDLRVAAGEEDDLLASWRLAWLVFLHWLGLLRRRRHAFWATAAFTSALNAAASTCSPSWMSIALSRVAFQAGIEEARRVREAGPPGERELHDFRVRLAGADDPVGATRPGLPPSRSTASSISAPRPSRGRLPGSAPACGPMSSRANPP